MKPVIHLILSLRQQQKTAPTSITFFNTHAMKKFYQSLSLAEKSLGFNGVNKVFLFSIHKLLNQVIQGIESVP